MRSNSLRLVQELPKEAELRKVEEAEAAVVKALEKEIAFKALHGSKQARGSKPGAAETDSVTAREEL
jgi:hypothetical protein